MVLIKPQHDVGHNPGLCQTPDSFGCVPEVGELLFLDGVSHLHTLLHQEELELGDVNIDLGTLLVRFSGDTHYVRLSQESVKINRAVLSVDVIPAVQNQPAGHGCQRQQNGEDQHLNEEREGERERGETKANVDTPRSSSPDSKSFYLSCLPLFVINMP